MRGFEVGARKRHTPRRRPDALTDTPSLLRWVYVARVCVASVVFVAAAFYFKAVSSGVILTLAIVALLTVVFTGVSLFQTHVRGEWPSLPFRYTQLLFDLGLVTAVVHVTGGAESDFASLYILVIAVSGLMVPFRSSLLVTIVAAALYVGDILWTNPSLVSVTVWLQIGAFLAVAFAVGSLSHRLRVVGVQRSVLEEEVRRLRLEASDILREISSAVVTVDGSGTLVYANSAAERLLDFSGREYLQQPFLEFLGSRSRELLAAILAAQREGRRQVRAEGTIRREDRSCAIGMTTTLHKFEGGPASVTAIFTDISDQKRLEELHLRTQRLQAVAELSASLAHEIKNPLASIRSSVEQLGRSQRADADDQFLAQLIVRESDRLSRLLSEFLDFSRVQVRDARPVDLGAIARAAVELARAHPDCPADARIAIHDRSVHVPGDEDLLHRVVLNLVLNALQACNGDAEITVDVLSEDPAGVPSDMLFGPCAVLRVSDNGPGIPAELRERLFEPFVTGRTGGTGLGLAIVQRAVEAHHGAVLVESETTRGTTFSVFLPLEHKKEAAA